MSISTSVVVARNGSDEPSLEDAWLDAPREHQVLITLEASGICQSQIHQLRQAKDGPGGDARALGHEALGVVDVIGEAVTSVTVGARVLVSWIPVAEMADTRSLQPASVHLQDGVTALSPDVFTWATRTVVDEAYLHPVEADVDAAASIIGCAVPTGAGAVLRTGAMRAGDVVAVIGAGGVGLNAIAAAKAAGASTVIAIDVDAGKLAFARTQGASLTIDTTVENASDAVASAGIDGADVVLDCVAAQSTFDVAVSIARSGVPGVRPGGTVVIVGVARTPLALDARHLQSTEKRIVGSFGGSTDVQRDFPEYLAWARSGALDLGSLVTRRYDLDSIGEAVDDLRAGTILGRAIVLL